MVKADEQETEQEILAPQAQTVDSMTLALLNKSEIDQQIATAKKWPRQLTTFYNKAIALATQDPETADECVYALPRDGKTVEGPSARFAELVLFAWGNSRAGARIIDEGEEFVTAMGSFFDMEQNIHVGYEVKRRIVTKQGKRFNTDMIGMTANAACSIALRNAILKGIPKAIWRKPYDRVRQTIAGDIKTLDARRSAMLKAFALMGAKEEQIFTLLDIKGAADITLDHLVTLRGIYNAIREGETTVTRAFTPPETQDTNLAAKSAQNLEDIKEKYKQDPKRAEELRAEADRQLKQVAEKYGARQPEATSGNGDVAPVAAETEKPAAPPNEQQPGEPPSSHAQVAEAADDTGTPPAAPKLPLQPEGENQHIQAPGEQHGIPGIFEDSKPKKKR